MKSTIGDLNKYKQSWKTRADVNSTIVQLDNKIKSLTSKKKKATSTQDKVTISNEIKYYSHLLYEIKLDYYQIVGALDAVSSDSKGFTGTSR